jgi:hypothetical protein
MTKDDVIRMAREAGFVNSDAANIYQCLERFAKLVYEKAWADTALAATHTVTDAAIAKEREACAKVCEETTASWTQHLYNEGCIDCAKAIRARKS